MKFTAFKAGDGDSCLIQGSSTNILVDGGRVTPFREHILPTLEAMHQADKKLDLVCVSHIDDDHITGIVELIERRREWAVHRHQTGGANPPNPNHPVPNFNEPPIVDHIWHNGFGETFADAANPIVNALAFHSQLLDASRALEETQYGLKFGRIAQGAKLAIKLQLMLGHSPMGIKLNDPSNGLRLTSTPAKTVDFAGTQLKLLTPEEARFAALELEWNAWVADNQQKIEDMKEEFQASLGASSGNALDFLAFAANLAQSGDLDGISPPNLASICFLAEENNKTILMTGDDASSHVLKGLEAHNLMDANGSIHVDVLKVSHHGADANTTEEFARRVIADHYVFCGNGRHHNPETDVINRYVNSRISGDNAVKSPNAKADDPFKLWFNYSVENDAVKNNQNYLDVITAAKINVEGHKATHPNVVDFEFAEGDSFTLDLN